MKLISGEDLLVERVLISVYPQRFEPSTPEPREDDLRGKWVVAAVFGPGLIVRGLGELG